MNHSGSYVVGIAGGSASGKTTFTSGLADALTSGPAPLRTEVIGMDRYFYRGANGGPTYFSPSLQETFPNNNHPGSADNARLVTELCALRNSADAPDVILLEGLMTLHIPEVRAILDLRLFVDLEPDGRALRRLLRDMKGGRGRTDPEFIAACYLECAKPGHDEYVEPSRRHADLIIRGDGDPARAADLVAQTIRSELKTSTVRTPDTD